MIHGSAGPEAPTEWLTEASRHTAWRAPTRTVHYGWPVSDSISALIPLAGTAIDGEVRLGKAAFVLGAAGGNRLGWRLALRTGDRCQFELPADVQRDAAAIYQARALRQPERTDLSSWGFCPKARKARSVLADSPIATEPRPGARRSKSSFMNLNFPFSGNGQYVVLISI